MVSSSKPRTKLFSGLVILVFLLLQLLSVSQLLDTSQVAKAAGAQGQLLVGINSEIDVINGDGTNFHKIADGDEAAWSPDGNHIAFVQNASNSSLFIANADGSSSRKIADNVSTWKWSSDSNKIAFFQESSTDSSGGQLYLIDATGSNLKKLADMVSNFYWSSDGTKIVYSLASNDNYGYGNIPVYVANSDGSAISKVTVIKLGQLYGFWADNKHVVYGDYPGGQLDVGMTENINLINLDGTGNFNLTSRTTRPNDRSVTIMTSPDGNKVLLNPSGGNIVVGDAQNPAAPIKKLSLPGIGCEEESWSMDNNKIIYPDYSYDTLTMTVSEFDLNTDKSRQIAAITPFNSAGQCPVVYFSVSDTGLVVFAGLNSNTDSASYAFYVLDVTTGQYRKLAALNDFYQIYGWQPVSHSKTYGSILPDFYNVWKLSDQAIANGGSNKSWLWGPDAFASKTENYKEAKGGQRQVQYFDKARMEINNPDGDRSNLYFVTNGLLPKELMTGKMQTGDNTFEQRSPVLSACDSQSFLEQMCLSR